MKPLTYEEIKQFTLRVTPEAYLLYGKELDDLAAVIRIESKQAKTYIKEVK